MGIIDDDMKRVVDEQRLGFIATIGADGTPNLSPRGTIAVWDDDHLAFCDIRSPNTTRNLRTNPAVEVNVIDPILRKGYRFKGAAEVREPDEDGRNFYEKWGLKSEWDKVRAVILIAVEKATAVTSPAYDWGATEAELKETYLRRVNERFAHG